MSVKETKTKHSPGPWRVDDDLNVRGASSQGIGPLLAEVYGHGHLPERATAREANAYLIAAAPTLLESCKATLPFIEWFREMQMKGEIRCSPEALQQASDILNLHDYDIRVGLEAAIALATKPKETK